MSWVCNSYDSYFTAFAPLKCESTAFILSYLTICRSLSYESQAMSKACEIRNPAKICAPCALLKSHSANRVDFLLKDMMECAFVRLAR